MSATGVMGQVGKSVPKLVIGITIDRLRTDYLEAFSPLYGDGGFKRLLDNGVVYNNVEYSTSGVDRASSVSSIYTGTVPYNHGVIGEMWLDRATMRPVYCVDDSGYEGEGTNDKSSPKNLLVSTIGDELKFATDGKAMVYSIAPYREVAILSAGHAADWAMWIDDNSGAWVGSTFYSPKPSWVKYANSRSLSDRISDINWVPSNYAVESYNYYLLSNNKSSFSHKFKGSRCFREFKNSGCVNEEVTKMARSCINSSNMGSDEVPDLLSLCYYAGTFDNRSMKESAAELQDTYVRLDMELEKLFAYVDQLVGLGNTLFFITSTGYDNESTPDLSKFRMRSRNFQINRCAALLNLYLSAVYGSGNFVESYYGNQLYLNHKLLEEKQLNLAEVQERCEDFLFQYSGVRDVYTSQRITQGAWTPGISKIRNSYNPKCSGDIMIEVIPGWNLVNEDVMSSKLVRDSYFGFPLIFFGYGLEGKTTYEKVYVDCIAPTVAHFMRIRAPNACMSAPLNGVGK
jgi:hypothetical protein